jgi:hypothetical protein
VQVHLRNHIRLKKPERTAALNLGHIQGDVGVVEKTIGGARFVAREIYANANADDDLVLADPIGLANRFDDASSKSRGVFWGAYSGLENNKFVATDAGNRVPVAHGLQEPRGHVAQQLVADVVSEHVVDLLKTIEIEKQDRELVAPRGVDQRLSHPLLQQRTVRKAR